MAEADVRKGLMAKMGLPPTLGPGLIALIFFGTGTSVMASWISQFFVGLGFDMNQVGVIMAVAGVTGAVGGWFGGALGDRHGPRTIVGLGAAVWLLTTACFLLFGVRAGLWGILLTFGLTGLSMLFPYAFMGWISYTVPSEKLGIAMGLFWTSMALGMPLGSFYSAAMRPLIGDLWVIASGIPMVIIGGGIGIGMVPAKRREGEAAGLGTALLLAVRKPAIGVVGIVRIINTLGMMGLMVFLPVWLVEKAGFGESAGPIILGSLSLVNIVSNLVFGMLGDRMGWKRTVTWYGCIGGFVTLLLVYYVPIIFGANLFLEIIAAMLFGAALAAFVPLSALGPALAPAESGAAVAVLSLAQGVSQFLGSGMGGWLYAAGGASLTTWVLAACYLLGAALMVLVPDPQRKARAAPTAPAAGAPA